MEGIAGSIEVPANWWARISTSNGRKKGAEVWNRATQVEVFHGGCTVILHPHWESLNGSFPRLNTAS
jgi:hypothetical protein